MFIEFKNNIDMNNFNNASAEQKTSKFYVYRALQDAVSLVMPYIVTK